MSQYNITRLEAKQLGESILRALNRGTKPDLLQALTLLHFLTRVAPTKEQANISMHMLAEIGSKVDEIEFRRCQNAARDLFIDRFKNSN